MKPNNKSNTPSTRLKKFFTSNTITMLCIIVAYILIYFYITSDGAKRQITNMVTSVSCYVALAVSLNLVVGLLGELSLGHAGFMSVGLFSGCLLSIQLSPVLPVYLSIPVSMVFGGLFAAVIGFAVGLPALRLKGDYLAIVTLGCGEIIKNVITSLDITGGGLGLDVSSIVPQQPTHVKLLPYSAMLVIITVLVVMNIKNSRHGRAIMAIRDNRIAAEATGINVTYYKLIVFVIAAFFAGMAGVLYGHSMTQSVKAVKFDYNMSIEILVMVVLGGMGSIRGSIIAAIILRALPEVLRGLEDYRMLVYSIVLIVLMILNENQKFRELKSKINPKNLFGALSKKGGNTQPENTSGGTK